MLIDSHCHLLSKRYNKNPTKLVAEAEAWGVNKIINIGTSIKDSIKAIDVASKFPNVYATVGVYPHENRSKEISDLEIDIQKLLCPKVVAIGECGIDITNWKGGRDVKEQIKLFDMQIRLAAKHKLPLSIHNRNGDEIVIERLKKVKNSTGVMHCFSSNWEFAKKILDLGYYISFSGNITYPSSKHLIETAEQVPLDRFLLETDSPYLSPQEQRGEVNTPKNVKIVAQKVAEIKKLPFEEVCKHAFNNTNRIFNL